MDSFHRISDDLARLILAKIMDAKSLTALASVSKRFAKLVPQTLRLCVRVPQEIPNLYAYPVEQSPRALYLRRASAKFTGIEAMTVMFPYEGIQRCGCAEEAFFKWKAQFDGDGLGSLLIVKASSHRGMFVDGDSMEVDGEEVNGTGGHNEYPDLSSNNELMLDSDAWLCIEQACQWYKQLEGVVSGISHPHLQQVLATDEMGEGNLSMDQEKLREMRRRASQLEMGRVYSNLSKQMYKQEMWSMKSVVVPMFECRCGDRSGWYKLCFYDVEVILVINKFRLKTVEELLVGGFGFGEEEHPLDSACCEALVRAVIPNSYP